MGEKLELSNYLCKKSKVKILLLKLGILLFLLLQKVGAVQNYYRDSTHRGIVEITPYQIYPENRVGNGIYLNKKLLDSHPNRMIINIVSIKNTKSSIYLYKNQSGALGLGIVKNKADGEARFWKVDEEFYQYNNRTTGIQRVFRIFEKKIKPLLSNVRTGRGVTTSPTHAVFYHIIDSREITITNPSGEDVIQRNYTFRLHVVNRKLENIGSILNLIIKDTSYNLKLSWEDESSISYTLSNGKKQKIDLREYVPHLF